MSVLLRKQYNTIKKEKLSEQAKSVLKSMYDTTDGFKDLKATRKIKPKFEAFYNKLKESKPEAIVGVRAKSKAAPKKSADDFKAARARRKPQSGVPKDKSAIEKDAVRPAISKRGKRTSKAGNTYYEYRDNRLDKNPSKYPMLEKGGKLNEDDADEYARKYYNPVGVNSVGEKQVGAFKEGARYAKEIYAKGGETKVPNTYIPNKDVKELMVVLKNKMVKLKGDDILDGVYAKNSALKIDKKASKNMSAEQLYTQLLDKAKTLKEDDVTSMKKEDIQKLLTAGYDAKDIEIIYFGVRVLEPSIDISYEGSGLLGYTEESIPRNIEELVKAAKNNVYEIGLKYPQFNWKNIIKKYNISKDGKEIDGVEMKFGNDSDYNVYTVFEGDKVVVGTSTNRVEYKNGKKQPERDYYKKDPKELADFTGGYWGVVTSSKEKMYDIAKMILSQKDGYVKDMNLFVNRLGGIGARELDKNDIKYEHGGYMAHGGGFNKYGEPYGFEEETDSVYEIHHKPEMNPNNPYLIWDKIDGIYIAEFPNRQRALHFIDYKKYGYAKGGYMAKGGETHRLDSIFEDGGEIAEGNLEMAMSNVKAIGHHAMELKSLLDENTSIEAWVVAKLERAETDLSDVTHYIDGLKGEEVESDTYFAEGGELTPYIIWVSKDGEKREMFGEYKSKRAADMKMNKLWESGEYKTMGNKPKSMYEKEGFYGDGGMMAKGGKLKIGGDDFSFLLELSDDELSKRLDLVRKQQNINGEQYFAAINKKESTQKIEDSRKNLDNQEKAIIEARLIKYDKRHKMAKGGRLSRKQKQLDLNKNGKLDSQDFKMLRAGRKNARKK
jgi:hypothetical protein